MKQQDIRSQFAANKTMKDAPKSRSKPAQTRETCRPVSQYKSANRVNKIMQNSNPEFNIN